MCVTYLILGHAVRVSVVGRGAGGASLKLVACEQGSPCAGVAEGDVRLEFDESTKLKCDLVLAGIDGPVMLRSEGG